MITGSWQDSNFQDPERQQQISIQAQEPGYLPDGPEYERPRSKWPNHCVFAIIFLR